MDQFPYPNSDVPRLTVPYLAGFEYDHDDFATFPARAGFEKDGSWDFSRPFCQVAAFSQCWLFFGLIESFTRRRLDKENFIRRDDSHEAVIDTTSLGKIIEESAKRLRRKTLRSRVLTRIRAKLLEAARASSILDRIRDEDLPSAAVFLSIKILIIYLSEMFDAAFWLDLGSSIHPVPLQDSFRTGVLEGEGTSHVSLPGRLLMERMRQSGWCIHQIMEVCRSHDYCVVYYLSSIRRIESWNITHESCSEMQCCAYNIKDDASYRFRHVEETAKKNVAAIVKAGGVPLIRIRSVSESEVKLEISAATPYSQYTAVSHVWIDGRGNPNSNSMPRCQLQELAAQVSAVSAPKSTWMTRIWNKTRDSTNESPLLWIDTLCIPVSKKNKPLRKKAIHRMALIYAGASQVLVLDAELSHVNQKGEDRELLDALISCLRWNSRCWTLEEGALARKCLFQFRDSAREVVVYNDWNMVAMRALKSPWRTLRALMRFTVDEALMRRPTYDWPPRTISNLGHGYLRHQLASAALKSAQTDVGLVSHAEEREVPHKDLQLKKFVRTWNDVGKRSTTKPDDIHPIIANLTDLSAAQIMSLATPVERTKTILHCMGRFPLDILWDTCFRPLANKDTVDRWVPSTPGPTPLVEMVTLRHTRKGLVVDTEDYWKPPEVICIPQGSMPLRFCFRPRDGDSEAWYWIECIQAADDELPRNAAQMVCLILSPVDTQNGKSATLGTMRGARLLVTKGTPNSSGSLYTRYDCPLTCTVRDHCPSTEELPQNPILTREIMPSDKRLVLQTDFDPKDREKFAMRSRDFYHGAGMIAADRLLVAVSGAVPALAVILSVLLTYSNYWYIPDAAMGILTVVLTLLGGSVGIAAISPILRWKHARAYKAWKATFEEDWKPNKPILKRLFGHVHPCRKRRRDSDAELRVHV